MLRSKVLSPGLALFGVMLAGIVLLHGCQDRDLQPTEPSLASASATQTLTIQGFGAGSGSVTVAAVGGMPALDCVITLGQAAATGCIESYPTGTVVVLVAVPAPGFAFAGWSGGCTGLGICEKAMTTARTVKAKFAPLSALTISGFGTGSGAVTSQVGLIPAIACTIVAGVAAPVGCSASYPTDAVVTLTATPLPGSTFTGWSGGCTGTGTCQKTMNIARSITASFTGVQTFNISVTGFGSGSGAVASQLGLLPPIACTILAGQAALAGCSASYPGGTSLTLTATPLPGSTFGGWGGACQSAGNAPSCSITVSQVASASATFTPVGAPAPEATLGKWSAPFTTPIVAIHLALSMDGRALLWGLNGEPWVWDPTSYPANPGAGFSEVSWPSEMFCGGHTYLPDGRLMVIGGEIASLGYGYGIADVNAFGAGGWSNFPAMAFARWYPTATTLPNGDIVAISGSDQNAITVTFPELFNGSSWRTLTGANLNLPLYPRTFVEPKQGRLFYAGENPISRYLDPNANGGNGAWISAGTRHLAASRGYGSAVMLDGKVLNVGGGGGVCPTGPNSSAELIDLHAASPAWRYVGSMAYARRQTNATILANGKVLVNGGTSACGFDEASGSVYAAELWDPVTENWSLMASGAVQRIYHSAAILLPDARVLVAGGNNQSTAEVYTPSYLFATDGSPAQRPSYALAASTAGYSQTLSLATSDAASIEKVTLVRLGAATHAFNQSQQLNTLSFGPSPDGQTLNVTMPASGRLAPPGPYMLFIINGQGVPSVAKILTIN